ncbi:MAG TPA: DUF6519 domain-containing protein [Actinomycetota bacterium]
MSSDVSRVRFDPRDDFAGLVMQQGRLLLDGDFNEYVAMLDRRLRAETNDLTSFEPDPDRSGVAWVPRLTPDAFRVTASGGELTIGRGRMYVDGLLAENHGGEPDMTDSALAEFDPILAEEVGTEELSYDAQPYWPEPDPLPEGGPHLAYLDVWHREVTHLEDPDLVEKAVGVDTTARLQTAWQVRLLPNIGSATCTSPDEDIPGWLDVISPSGGRLTTGTVEVDDEDDPCELPPSGGYRGLENQTYRVEIHAGGAPGTATWKWSRENASVVQAVVEMVSPTVLRLASVAKDDVLRIFDGSWVEILDDNAELAQRPGAIRQVDVDDSARTISFTDPLPAELQPADADDAARRHFRVRRWDQSGIVRSGTGDEIVDLDAAGSSGLLTVPANDATQVVLENGVVVSFSVTDGGRFRSGDHWIFAARTADTSIEILDAAPPRGVHHHYARLGTVTFPDSATSCRRLWPPVVASTGGDDCGDCTVCVTAESHASGELTINDAIAELAETGGTICLGTGMFHAEEGIFLEGVRAIRIRGQGMATIIFARGLALSIERSSFITIENLALVGGPGAPAVSVRSASTTTLQDLVVLSYGIMQEKGGEPSENAAVQVSGVCPVLTLRRNILVGLAGIASDRGERMAGFLAAGLRIEDNIIGGREGSIDLGGVSAYQVECWIADNEIINGERGALVATGGVGPPGILTVTNNRIMTGGGGIVVGPDAVVDSNSIKGMGNAEDGIAIEPGGFPAEPGHVRITGNRVQDMPGVGIALRAPVVSFMVKQNVLTDIGTGIATERRGRADSVAIENNEVTDVAEGVEESPSAVGITVSNADSVAILSNTVKRVGTSLVSGRVRNAIGVIACEDVRIADNLVDEVGPPLKMPGLAAGIFGVGPSEFFSVGGNTSRHDGLGDGMFHALLIRSVRRDVGWVGHRKAVVALEEGMFILNAGWAYTRTPRADHVTVSSNLLVGGGTAEACVVSVFGDVVFDANQCEQVLSNDTIAVAIDAQSITASSNRVRGDEAMLVLLTAKNRFAAVGNLASGGTHFGGAHDGLFDPWEVLNPIVS